MQPELCLISPGDFVTTGWSGGTTRQIAIAPAGAVYADRGFLWRVSSATVELDESDFTPLPDYERYIATLQGSIVVRHDGGEPLTLAPGQVHRFDGGAATHSTGRCTDFNLMLRKGRCTGRMLYLELPENCTLALPALTQAAPQETLLLYCVRGTADFALKEQSLEFAAGQTCLSRCRGGTLHTHGSAAFMAVQAAEL